MSGSYLIYLSRYIIKSIMCYKRVIFFEILVFIVLVILEIVLIILKGIYGKVLCE